MLGANLYSHDITPRVLDALYSIGIRAIRYWIFGQFNDGSGVIRGVDSYEFTRVTRDLQQIRNAGMYAYANWSHVPAFMSGNLPAYHAYQSWISDSSTKPADLVWTGPDGSRWRLATAAERPYMHAPNIPHIDGDQVERFGYALASECSDLVDYIGSWNEPGGRVYWPPVQVPPYETAYERLFDEVLAPFARGYRRGCTGGAATFVGPEADVDSAIALLCDIERRREYRVFDILSFHPYPWGSPFADRALARTEQFMTHARAWADGRPIWSTETVDPSDNGQTPLLFKASAERYPDLRAQFIFDPHVLFVGAGGGNWSKKGFEFKLTAQGKSWKSWAVDGQDLQAGKRRSTR